MSEALHRLEGEKVERVYFLGPMKFLVVRFSSEYSMSAKLELQEGFPEELVTISAPGEYWMLNWNGKARELIKGIPKEAQ